MFLKTLDLKDTATERTKRPFTKIIFSFSEYTIYRCLGVKMISFVTYFCQKKNVCIYLLKLDKLVKITMKMQFYTFGFTFTITQK